MFTCEGAAGREGGLQRIGRLRPQNSGVEADADLGAAPVHLLRLLGAPRLRLLGRRGVIISIVREHAVHGVVLRGAFKFEKETPHTMIRVASTGRRARARPERTISTSGTTSMASIRPFMSAKATTNEYTAQSSAAASCFLNWSQSPFTPFTSCSACGDIKVQVVLQFEVCRGRSEVLLATIIR